MEKPDLPNTTHQWWICVPAHYKDDQPDCVMVFQDSAGYTGFVPTVFDNLIAKGEMPVTVAVFINPGSGLISGDALAEVEHELAAMDPLGKVEKVAHEFIDRRAASRPEPVLEG
jgi:hypothetical protein